MPEKTKKESTNVNINNLLFQHTKRNNVKIKSVTKIIIIYIQQDV